MHIHNDILPGRFDLEMLVLLKGACVKHQWKNWPATRVVHSVGYIESVACVCGGDGRRWTKCSANGYRRSRGDLRSCTRQTKLERYVHLPVLARKYVGNLIQQLCSQSTARERE